MREELLAHLTHLYEQELAAHADDPVAALAAARERFGDPASLRTELQATVPRIERVLFVEIASTRWLRRRPGESVGAHIRRNAVWQVVIQAVVSTLLITFIFALSRPRAATAREINLAGFIMFAVAYGLIFPIIVYVPVLVCVGIQRELSRLSALVDRERRGARMRIVAYYALNMFIFAGSIGLFMYLLGRAITFPLLSPLVFWCIVAASALVALPVTALSAAEVRRWDDWAGIDLGTPPAANARDADS